MCDLKMLPTHLFYYNFARASAQMKGEARVPFIASAGRILDDYLPSTPNPFPPTSLDFYKHQWMKAQKFAQYYYSWYKLRKVDPGFNPKTVARETAGPLYREMLKLIASGKTSALKDVVTESVHTNIKSEIKRRKKGEKHKWNLESMEPVKVQHLTVMGLNSEEQLIAQISCEFKSKQKYSAKDKSGKKIAGQSKLKDVDEIWVLERPYLGPGSETIWRFCGVLRDSQDLENKKSPVM